LSTSENETGDARGSSFSRTRSRFNAARPRSSAVASTSVRRILAGEPVRALVSSVAFSHAET
jgi:hypothetical protein